MATIKLHEATKQFEIANKLAMFFLEKVNLPVKSHSSVITVEQLELLREFAASSEKVKALEADLKKGVAAKPLPLPPPLPQPPKKKSGATTQPAAKIIRVPAENKQAATEKKQISLKVTGT
ncbi:MAG: hypothetical protein WCL37_02970, partial [Chrysiogenales bacterium]